MLFSYFQIYLQRLWELASDLPARFPDGTALDQKLSWILGVFVREHVRRLYLLDERAFHLFERAIAVSSTYVLVPLAMTFVLALYAWRTDLRTIIPGWRTCLTIQCRPRWAVQAVLILHCILAFAAGLISALSYRQMKSTLGKTWLAR